MAEAPVYEPSPWGLEFHGSEVDELLGAGAAGVGKSMVLLHDADQQIMIEHQRCANRDHPHHIPWKHSRGHALHLRRTLPMLRDTIARAHIHFRAMDPDVRWNEPHHTFTFASGFQYELGHCKDLTSWTQYYGREFTHISFDELVQFNEDQYDHIASRLRSPDPVLSKMLKIRACSNPLVLREGENFTVKDPNWVRRRFVEPAPQGRVVLKRKLIDPRNRKFIGYITSMYLPGQLEHNPDPAFVASYLRRLVALPSHQRMALLMGNWFLTQNSYFGDVWNPSVHICRPFKIPEYWRRFRSMDWGYKAPGVIHWWALDDEDALYCTRELVFQGRTDLEMAQKVKEVEKEMGLWDDRAKKSRITGPADTQLWEKRGQHAKSMVLTFLENGVPWTQAEKNKKSIERGGGGGRRYNAQLMAKRLRDYNVARGKPPGLVFFDTCSEIIKTIPSIIAEDSDPETPVDWGDDHAFDSACYATAYASHGPRALAGIRKKRELWDDEDEKFNSKPIGPKKRRSYDAQF